MKEIKNYCGKVVAFVRDDGCNIELLESLHFEVLARYSKMSNMTFDNRGNPIANGNVIMSRVPY